MLAACARWVGVSVSWISSTVQKMKYHPLHLVCMCYLGADLVEVFCTVSSLEDVRIFYTVLVLHGLKVSPRRHQCAALWILLLSSSSRTRYPRALQLRNSNPVCPSVTSLNSVYGASYTLPTLRSIHTHRKIQQNRATDVTSNRPTRSRSQSSRNPGASTTDGPLPSHNCTRRERCSRTGNRGVRARIHLLQDGRHRSRCESTPGSRRREFFCRRHSVCYGAKNDGAIQQANIHAAAAAGPAPPATRYHY